MVEAVALRRLLEDRYPDATPFERIVFVATALGVMVGAGVYPAPAGEASGAVATIAARAAQLHQAQQRRTQPGSDNL